MQSAPALVMALQEPLELVEAPHSTYCMEIFSVRNEPDVPVLVLEMARRCQSLREDTYSQRSPVLILPV